MFEREVIKTAKDEDGDIIAMSNNFKGWSLVTKDEAIMHIESKRITYFVEIENIGKVDVLVINGPNGKYLRTNPAKTARNILKDLPDYKFNINL